MLQDKNHGTSVPVKTLLNTASPNLPKREGVQTSYVPCLSNYEEKPRKHLYARFALNTSFTIMFTPATLTANAQSVTVG